MTDSTPRPSENRPEHGAADGGHLANETVPASVARPSIPEEGGSFRRRDRRLFVPVVATAVVAALIGGSVGAGIAIAADPGTAVTSTSSGGRGVVINNPATATAVSAIAAKASPSVVTISVSAANQGGTGSGIVLSADGYVLTNNHVVTLDGATSGGKISVSTSEGRIYEAKIVGSDPLNDLAVIKLTGASGLTPATFGNSDSLNVGDAVVAIGAPLDLPNTVTTGIVSALDRSIAVASSAAPKAPGGGGSGGGGGSSEDSPFNFWNFGGGPGTRQAPTNNIYLSVLQTDAAINPGNSGGALVNSQGEVIGVNVAIAGTGSSSSGQSGSIGVGFAIPSAIAKRIADAIIAGTTPTHGQLGVTTVANQTATTGTIAGVKVAQAPASGPAAAAGIKQGDIITAVGGVPVTSYTDLAAQVRSYAAGSKVEVTYYRGGQAQTATVTLGKTSVG